MGVRELVGDANGVPASEKVKKHCFRRFKFSDNLQNDLIFVVLTLL